MPQTPTHLQKLEPALALVSLRLFLTTKAQGGSDCLPVFHWNSGPAGNTWQSAPMNLERRDGKTDLFERHFDPSISHKDLEEWRRIQRFNIKVGGTSVWKIAHYAMIGNFRQFGLLRHAPSGGNTASSWGWTDLGWRLMATRDSEVNTDPTTPSGDFVLSIVLNGTF